MAQVSTAPAADKGFGATARRDPWWLAPLLVFLGLTAFVICGLVAAYQDGYFEIRQSSLTGGDFYAEHNRAVAPYLAPFYAPLIYDKSPPSSVSHHAWFNTDLKANLGLPAWFPLSSAFLILAFPGLFRFTCYYYRKAYYRAFWMDPPACAVGEPRKGYLGENHWPLLFQNSHRYWMYIAVIFLVLLGWDALLAFWWPTLDAEGVPTGAHQLGMGLGTLIMVANVVLLAGFTLGCNSVRHLVGGRLNHFACLTCPANGGQPVEKVKPGYYTWRFSSWFNEHHMLWAWLSLFSVGFTDLYIRLCSMGVWHDPRIF